MSDSPDTPPSYGLSDAIQRFRLRDLFQLVTAAAVLLAVGRVFGVYWAIISVPVLFAAMAAINFNDVDRETDVRLKRLMSLLTLIGCGGAWLYQTLMEQVN